MDRDAIIAAMMFGGSGSGGGSGLPDVTISDNGKSLKVVSGAWAAADDEFVVTFTKSGAMWLSDYGQSDITNAVNAKKRVYGKVNGGSITDDANVSHYSLLLPLEGTSTQYGCVFGGALQSATNTVFCTFVVYGLVVTAYTKTVAIPDAIAPAPFVVNYTITGQSGNTYTLSADATLAQILAAKAAGREIKAVLTTIEGTAELPLTTSGLTFVCFSMAAPYDLAYSLFAVSHYTNDGVETAEGRIVPISTIQMSYNPSTDELSITNVPEV